MALVPSLSEVGDILAHIRGGCMPGLLRAESPGSRTVEWVGGCYVHKVEDVYSGSDWENWADRLAQLIGMGNYEQCNRLDC